MKDILHEIETLGNNDEYSYVSSCTSPTQLHRRDECGKHIRKTPSLDDYDNYGINREYDYD